MKRTQATAFTHFMPCSIQYSCMCVSANSQREIYSQQSCTLSTFLAKTERQWFTMSCISLGKADCWASAQCWQKWLCLYENFGATLGSVWQVTAHVDLCDVSTAWKQCIFAKTLSSELQLSPNKGITDGLTTRDKHLHECACTTKWKTHPPASKKIAECNPLLVKAARHLQQHRKCRSTVQQTLINGTANFNQLSAKLAHTGTSKVHESYTFALDFFSSTPKLTVFPTNKQ